MNQTDRKYLDIIEDIFLDGQDIQARNAQTRRIVNPMVTFDSTPLVSIRRTAWKQALREMEWFLSGSNDVNTLDRTVRKWWNPWADKSGFVKNNYSVQFRFWETNHQVSSDYKKNSITFSNRFDQIKYLLKEIKDKPNSRRAVITTWNTPQMAHEKTPITNCHGTVIQCYVNPDNTLDMTMYQRSADFMLGVPHNWIQYWAFLMYLAHQSGRKVGKFTWIGGDTHIYEQHMEVADKCRHTSLSQVDTPQLTYNPTSDNFKADDFTLVGEYKPVLNEKLELIV
jgi:thymidylate synthase